LFELLSQYKKTGFYRVSLEELKTLLGFIEYEYKTDSDYQEETPQMQLKLLSENESIPEDYKRVEYLQVWRDFKRVFLDPAIEAFNSNNKLDISNIHYEPIKTGRKITGLVFTFQKRLDEENLSREDKNALTYFQDYGLNKNQIMFLLQRIGSDLMFKRFNDAVTFNRYIDDTDSKHYRMKIWFDNKTQEPIKNLGGYLYEKVFPELKSKK
jgi:plasmid replication initiation protein